eukprot:175011-Chlamydomonas_euryale.AAC.5
MLSRLNSQGAGPACSTSLAFEQARARGPIGTPTLALDLGCQPDATCAYPCSNGHVHVLHAD